MVDDHPMIIEGYQNTLLATKKENQELFEEIVEVHQFWNKPPKQTEDSVHEIEPKIAVEKPAFFKKNPFEKKETAKKFWE